MKDETLLVLRGDKCAAIISSLNELFGIPIEEATDIYYESETAKLIEEKVADLHCRSEKYLATLVWEEHLENKSKPACQS